MDEKAGRRYAKQLNLSVTGTIGVLLRAKENGIIKSIKECLLELIDKGIYIKKNLLNKALQLAGEK